MVKAARTATGTGKARKGGRGTKAPAPKGRVHRPRSPGNVPSDASSQSDLPPDTGVRVGNRTFQGKPVALGEHVLDILPDLPDIRDRIYQPHLRALPAGIYPRIPFPVRDQGRSSSCTGFSLAHIVDHLRFRETSADNPRPVSARMLYEMARRNDEWAGSTYEGSSIRGAIKGFFRNGVCSEETAPSDDDREEWALTYEMAKEARGIRLGAYYRLQPDIADYHSAIAEIGAIYVSAQIHSNWRKPKDGRIEPGGKSVGGHAFVVVGYDDKGFWVLNSWGADWGANGVAHWSYGDWAATVMDAWVLQLGVPAPDAFGAIPRATPASTTGLFGFNDPHRGDIVGHFINIDDGRLELTGKYASPNAAEMQETVNRIASPDANGGQGFDHLVIYAHGGLNSLAAEAERIATWRRHDIFGRNRIYNFHLMWGSGFLDEAFGEISKAAAGRVGGIFDWMFETGIGRRAGSHAWRNMKRDAEAAFGGQPEYDGGFRGLLPLLAGLDRAEKRPVIHLVGHSAGAIVLGRLLSSLGRFRLRKLGLGGVHLMAPACTVDFFRTHYGPYLSGKGARKLSDRIYLYNLSDGLEQADTVSSSLPFTPSYSRSLLYLVSRAYEEAPGTPLAGMQAYAGQMPKGARLSVDLSRSQSTASTTHGGFDNDVATMSAIMSRILGRPAPLPPTGDELTGY